MLNKVSFVFVFTLESTASTSCWAVASFRRIFFASISHIFCPGRISNAALQNCSSVLLKGYSEKAFVFPCPFQQIFQ